MPYLLLFLHSIFSILITGLSLYWNVHASSDLSTVDSVLIFVLSPFLHNATCHDLSYWEWSIRVHTSILIRVTLVTSHINIHKNGSLHLTLSTLCCLCNMFYTCINADSPKSVNVNLHEIPLLRSLRLSGTSEISPKTVIGNYSFCNHTTDHSFLLQMLQWFHDVHTTV